MFVLLFHSVGTRDTFAMSGTLHPEERLRSVAAMSFTADEEFAG